jgi:hypothetical protein
MGMLGAVSWLVWMHVKTSRADVRAWAGVED